MASPPLNGLLAGSTGAALTFIQSGRAGADAATLPQPPGPAFDRPLAIGLLIALVLLAYWYRRIL